MAEKTPPLVGIVMGSDTDLPVMTSAVETLKKFSVPCEVRVISAHRTPARASEYARTAAKRGLKVIIVAAGGAAHLGGVIAAETILPVIGVPMATTSLAGLDSLLSIVQMPGGVPVACTAIGKPGAVNAAILAAQIIATFDPEMAGRIQEHKKRLAEAVAEKDARVQRELGG